MEAVFKPHQEKNKKKKKKMQVKPDGEDLLAVVQVMTPPSILITGV